MLSVPCPPRTRPWLFLKPNELWILITFPSQSEKSEAQLILFAILSTGTGTQLVNATPTVEHRYDRLSSVASMMTLSSLDALVKCVPSLIMALVLIFTADSIPDAKRVSLYTRNVAIGVRTSCLYRYKSTPGRHQAFRDSVESFAWPHRLQVPDHVHRSLHVRMPNVAQKVFATDGSATDDWTGFWPFSSSCP